VSVPKEKAEKVRELRLAGKTMTETAKLTGLSRNTVRKLEKGWLDTKGVHHPGWASEVEVSRLKSIAAAVEAGSQLLDRGERMKLRAELASTLVAKVQEFLPALKLKSAREAKLLLSEARELTRLLDRDGGGEEQPGVKHDITFNEAMDRFLRSKEVEVDEIEPPERPVYLGDVVDLEHLLPGGDGHQGGD